MILLPNDKEEASSKMHTQFETWRNKSYPILDQYGQNRYPVSEQIKTARKTIPFGAADTYIAHIREFPPPLPSG